MEKPREESEVLKDLTTLASSAGYAHAVAHICQRDNVIHITEKLKPSDMDRLFSPERLIRTELTTLVGLMAKRPLDLSLPPPPVIEAYVERTDSLMRELHRAIFYPLLSAVHAGVKGGAMPSEPWRGQGMREPIFYCTESAYAFQYRDLAPEKYGPDDDWMRKAKGFTSGQARTLARAMCALMDENGTRLLANASSTGTQPETWLPAFELSLTDLTFRTGLSQDVAEAFFRAFVYSGDNAAFKEVGDFNEVAARPLLPTGRGTVLLFSHYSIYEALYESPFFWMLDDKPYSQTAAKNRGAFTEQFAARRLAGVFGREHVHTNVNLQRGKETVGEVDVLVTFADRLIIVQAKAKKLTIAARKGNDNQLKSDFAAAIQDSYDQGWTCANEILSGGCRLIDDKGNEVDLSPRVREVFLLSVVSDHYPALAFQARQFLSFRTTDVIRPPLVMDVFFLDTLTEMLRTPLRLLSYVKLRVAASEKLTSGHELTILGYHLKQNLWLNEKFDRVILEDSIAQDLDTAMLVRRDNQPGDDTPVGILTKMRGTRYERLIEEIEAGPEPATLELGFHLLSMGEVACEDVNRALEAIVRQTRLDGKLHDVTLASSTEHCGVCFHCNPTPSPEAIARLEGHCALRKHTQRAAKWFGVSVGPNGEVQFGVTLTFPWEASADVEQLSANLKPAARVRDVLPLHPRRVSHTKLGRNDKCDCGSGRKYKKCCLNLSRRFE